MLQNTEKNYESTAYLLGRLFHSYIKSYSSQLLMAIFCMVVVACTTAVQAWLIQPILDSIFVQKEVKMLYIIPAIVFLNSVVKGIASFYEDVFIKRTEQKILADIQLHLYSHLMYADTKFLIEYSSGHLVSHMTSDINAMKRSVAEVLTGISKEFLTIIGLICIMFYQSVSLALIAFFIFPMAFYPIIQLGKKMHQIAYSMQEEISRFIVRLDETFQNTSIIKSYCREEYEIARAKKAMQRFLDLYNKGVYIEAASSPIMDTLGGIAIVVVICYGGSQVIGGYTTPGAFFSFIAALLMSYRPLKIVSRLNSVFQSGLAASRRLFVILDAKQEIVSDPNKQNANFKSFNIKFNDVHFSYKSEQKILDGFYMDIPEGKTVALVGESGVGKSTVLSLLQRLYDAESGLITIDGIDIQNIKISSLRNSIALVSQDVALFDDTILENIRYGRLNASYNEIIEAATAAAAHDFIINTPLGYNTQIGQSGIKLSGGQRQRVAIARAILKNAPILMLDEATSALDAISEKQIRSALDYLKKGRTTIVIAHRLSTIETADIIYVFADGRVVEHGTHKVLLEKSGAYARLYKQYREVQVI